MLMKHLEARQYVLLPCRILSTFFDGNFLNFPNIVLLREISKVLIELFIVSRLRECKGNFEGILYYPVCGIQTGRKVSRAIWCSHQFPDASFAIFMRKWNGKGRIIFMVDVFNFEMALEM